MPIQRKTCSRTGALTFLFAFRYNTAMDTVPDSRCPIIAVIGDVNEGKTSLIRAILAEADFGVVKDEAGTTKISEEKQVFLDGQLLFYLFDNPGFEYSSTLRREVQKSEEKFSLKGIINVLLRKIRDISESWQQNGLERERTAWQSVEECDVILWVIDVRKNPATSALCDTADLLAKAKKFIIPVFNFLPKETREDIVTDDYRKEIREILADYNLQSLICEYDTNRRDFHNEIDLLRAIEFSLKNFPEDRRRIESYIKRREEKERLRLENARLDICDALLRAACYAERKNKVPVEDVQREAAALKQIYIDNVTNFEKEIFRKLIKHWNYEDVNAVLECQFARINAEETTQGQPAEFNKTSGLQGVAAGATAGAVIGSIVTLGVGTVIGAGIGAAAGWFAGGLGFAKSEGTMISVAAHNDSLNQLCARLIDLTQAIRTRSKAVTTENNPVLKDRQASLPMEILIALQEFSAKNRTQTLSYQGEINPRKKELLKQVRTKLLLFLEQQIEL